MPAMLKFILFSVIMFLPGISSFSTADTKVEHYFENTDHELTVYHITGKEPGNTMMIIGGIQGDEPGGYLAADLYTDLILEKGNLIVVPRANFYSIKHNDRGVYGDMNRKFSNDHPDDDTDHDVDIVEILKQLMAQSDVLLNLHEGWGFYSPEFISDLRNPSRFGQCIIIDSPEYITDDGNTIDLENPALRVISDINNNIKDPLHHLYLNNHNTFSSSTNHPEQRGSATYNALSLFGIPAYGIETSKNIESIHSKVKYESLAINAFMREYDIIPEHPSISLPIPALDHLVIDLSDNSSSLAVKNGSTLSVPYNSQLTVRSIVANYSRGLSVDIVGTGNSNDLRRVCTISGPTHIHVYKDSYICGVIVVDIADTTITRQHNVTLKTPVELEHVEFKIADKNIVVSKDDTLHIVRGDIITITDALTSPHELVDIRINFYGYVGNQRYNDAEDRGYAIDTAYDVMQRFSLDAEGNVYKIEVLNGQNVIGNVFIEFVDPVIEYIIIERLNGTREAIAIGENINCSISDSMKILSIISNVTTHPGIEMFVAHGDAWEEISLPATLHTQNDMQIQFRRRSISIGGFAIRVTG